MSLHNAAKYLQSKGRGNDKMLVHMTPREVQGLQKLALASGGSLSINPNTGLVEAGWLENLLPVIAGVALNAFVPGAGAAVGSALGTSAAVGTGALVGGATTLLTGDLNKGLTAGLGAWGGAGLGEGLAGTAQAQSGMAEGAKALNTTPQAIATPEGMTKALEMGTETGEIIGMDPNRVQRFADAYQAGAAPAETGMGRLGQVGQGIKAVGQGITPAGGSLMMPALGAAAPMLSSAMQPNVPGQEEYKGGAFTKKRLSPSFQGFTPARPNPYYRPMGLGYTFAAGGLADITMAEGGQFDDSPGTDAMADGGIARFRNQGMVAPAGMSMGQGIARDTDDDTVLLVHFDGSNDTQDFKDDHATPEQYLFYADTGKITKNIGDGTGNYNLSLISASTFRNYPQGIRVSYKAGYDSSDVPNDLIMATMDYTKMLHKDRQESQSFSLQGEHVTDKQLSANFPPHIRRILDLYRIIL